MRRAASLHRDRARRQVRRPRGKTVETEPLVELRASCHIGCTRHDQILCEVDTDGSNLVHEFPFSDQIDGSHLNLGTSMPYTTHVESGKGNSLIFVEGSA